MKLSVIVCTQNRSYAIIDCLDSIRLAIQHAAPVEAEIVVVDNASDDDTSQVVSRWAETCPVPVKLVLEPIKGLANARNCGIRASTGALLAFTDDDCRMSATYVADCLRHDAADQEPVLRGGRVELGDPTDLPITIKLDDKIGRWRRSANSARSENLANCIVGANMAMRRSVADRIGPFDWRFSTVEIPAGEDADYVFRAYLSGTIVEYVPDMAVSHFHGRKHASDGKKLFRNYMIGSGALYAKHVWHDYNLCRQFVWDVKGMMRETVARKNLFWPDIGFSNTDKAKYYALGMARYFMILLKSNHPRSPSSTTGK